MFDVCLEELESTVIRLLKLLAIRAVNVKEHTWDPQLPK